jgi:hypothetical protein
MHFLRQLPGLFQQWDDAAAPGPWRPTAVGPAIWRHRLGKLLAGLPSVTPVVAPTREPLSLEASRAL